MKPSDFIPAKTYLFDADGSQVDAMVDTRERDKDKCDVASWLGDTACLRSH